MDKYSEKWAICAIFRDKIYEPIFLTKIDIAIIQQNMVT